MAFFLGQFRVSVNAMTSLPDVKDEPQAQVAQFVLVRSDV